MKQATHNGLVYFHNPGWQTRYPVKHGFFSRIGGLSPAPYSSLNTGPRSGDDHRNIAENLSRITSLFSVPRERLFCSVQVHGADIIHVSSSCLPHSLFSQGEPLRGDALVTDQEGILLGILTADCLPVLFVDPIHLAVGAVHAGWRGTLQGISGKTLRELGRVYGTRPEECLVAMRPAIGPCCYTVGENVVEKFLEESGDNERFINPVSSGQWRLNLEAINRHQLLQHGIREPNVSPGSVCTCCRNDLFFSVRSQGDPTGRQITMIGIRRE